MSDKRARINLRSDLKKKYEKKNEEGEEDDEYANATEYAELLLRCVRKVFSARRRPPSSVSLAGRGSRVLRQAARRSPRPLRHLSFPPSDRNVQNQKRHGPAATLDRARAASTVRDGPGAVFISKTQKTGKR